MTDPLQKLAYLLHSLLCNLPHLMVPEELAKAESGIGPKPCCFYFEEAIVDEWNCEDHKNWLEFAEQTMIELEVNTPDEGLRAVVKLVTVIRELETLLTELPNARTLAVKILARGQIT